MKHVIPAWLFVFNNISTTNLRIFFTIIVGFATTVKYLSSGIWAPSSEWLVFLATMSGIDVAQYYTKRKTYMASTLPITDDSSVEEDVTSTTDISEYNTTENKG